MNETFMHGGNSAIVIDSPNEEQKNRIIEAEKFFNQLYSKITAPHFAYLWTKQRGIFSFNISDETQREEMAKKTIELSESGVDVWHSVNPVSIAPFGGKRGDENSVSYQTACVVDIDIRSDAHKGDPTKLAADFDEAKSFLPFTPSLLIYSGYGLHAYYIFNMPIEITNENREELKRRNNLLLDVIRLRSNGKKIDGVGDLPRILRTPGTFNYKLGSNNAPICHIVEDSGLRFAPSQLDDKLNAMFLAETQKAQPITTTTTKSAQTLNEDLSDNRDFNVFRIRRMLDFISPSSLTYDDWLAVGMALKNSGCDCSDWEHWSRSDDRFKEGECERKWNGFNRDGYDIGTLFFFAQQGGYDAKNIYREWRELHTDFSTSGKKDFILVPRSPCSPNSIDDIHTSQIDSLKGELSKIAKSLADFETERDGALEKIRNLDKFDSNTMFSKDILTAAAFARLFDKQAFSNLKREVRMYGDKHRAEKVSINDWLADVKDRSDAINSRHNLLLTRRTEIKAQISSLSFIATDDKLANIVIPNGYSISDEHGVEKVSGEGMVTICRRPVIITGKTFSVEEKTYKINLAYKKASGELYRQRRLLLFSITANLSI